MKKRAFIGDLKNPKHMAARALIGALAGGLVGRYVTPKYLGYDEDRHATNLSTLIDASIGTMAGVNAPKAVEYLTDPLKAMKVMGVWGGAELAPVALHGLNQSTTAANNLSDSAKALKIPPAIPTQIADAIKTPEGRGAGAGAAAAGMAAILTGLNRAKSQHDIDSGTTRGGMVTKDFLKMVLPAMLAGGAIGNMTKKPLSS